MHFIAVLEENEPGLPGIVVDVDPVNIKQNREYRNKGYHL
jgi:hypothetical protein